MQGLSTIQLIKLFSSFGSPSLQIIYRVFAFSVLRVTSRHLDRHVCMMKKLKERLTENPGLLMDLIVYGLIAFGLFCLVVAVFVQ
jgi:hypothetical protein